MFVNKALSAKCETILFELYRLNKFKAGKNTSEDFRKSKKLIDRPISHLFLFSSSDRSFSYFDS